MDSYDKAISQLKKLKEKPVDNKPTLFEQVSEMLTSITAIVLGSTIKTKGEVSITNFPKPVPAPKSISINNLPTTQKVFIVNEKKEKEPEKVNPTLKEISTTLKGSAATLAQIASKKPEKIQQVQVVGKDDSELFKRLAKATETVVSAFKQILQVRVINQPDLSNIEASLEIARDHFQRMNKEMGKEKEKEDYSEIVNKLDEVLLAVEDSKTTSVSVNNFDNAPVALPIPTFKNSVGDNKQGLVDGDNHVQVDVLTIPSVSINPSDTEIGAVEIKNSTDDTRATVGANGLYVDVRASALPSDAATATNQTNGNQIVKANIQVGGSAVSTTNPVSIMPPLIGYLKTMEQGTLVPAAYDYISQTRASLTDTWVFKAGGAGGSTVGTITITYTGTDKLVISTVVKT